MNYDMSMKKVNEYFILLILRGVCFLVKYKKLKYLIFSIHLKANY